MDIKFKKFDCEFNKLHKRNKKKCPEVVKLKHLARYDHKQVVKLLQWNHCTHLHLLFHLEFSCFQMRVSSQDSRGYGKTLPFTLLQNGHLCARNRFEGPLCQKRGALRFCPRNPRLACSSVRYQGTKILGRARDRGYSSCAAGHSTGYSTWKGQNCERRSKMEWWVHAVCLPCETSFPWTPLWNVCVCVCGGGGLLWPSPGLAQWHELATHNSCSHRSNEQHNCGLQGLCPQTNCYQPRNALILVSSRIFGCYTGGGGDHSCTHFKSSW